MDVEIGTSRVLGLQRVLGRAIVRGEFGLKDFPTENGLSQQYQASRTVVREAIKMLAAKGLVTSRPKIGTRVSAMSQWNLLDPDVLNWLLDQPCSERVYRDCAQMCLAIGPVAAFVAAHSGQREHITAIGSQIEIMSRIGISYEALWQASRDFFIAVLRASGSPFFWRLRQLVLMPLSLEVSANRARPDVDVARHICVFNAIASGDGATAESHMRAILACHCL